MPPVAKKNPLKLNPLQLKTLTLLQYMATLERHSKALDAPEDGVRIINMPHAHGDHFHLGDAVVAAADATGLTNQAVYIALMRKGLVNMSPELGVVLLPAGLNYETGLAGSILHRSDH
jgi:hypothetical protein